MLVMPIVSSNREAFYVHPVVCHLIRNTVTIKHIGVLLAYPMNRIFFEHLVHCVSRNFLHVWKL